MHSVGCVPSAAVAVCWKGGVCPEEGVCLQGCLPGAGVCLGRACLPDTFPLWTEWQTPVKTLPCRNYVADGNQQPLSLLSVCKFSKFLIFVQSMTICRSVRSECSSCRCWGIRMYKCYIVFVHTIISLLLFPCSSSQNLPLIVLFLKKKHKAENVPLNN